MSYISYGKLWRSEFYDNVSAKDRVQNINFNKIKLKVNDTFKKDEKLTKLFVPFKDEDVLNKAHLDKKLSKIEGRLSFFEKDYIEFK